MSNIRLSTKPNGNDQYLKLKLEQKFDFIEILSLNISQDKAYENFCSDYGVIVGRVMINNGFGIPNAKVSVFIPISEEDKNNPSIKGLYPFETVNDVDSDGIRYNLLPKESDSQDPCYTPVGTFSAKREVLDNDEVLEVYCKYYKFTTTTNYAGDFMIFGVPLGTHVVHVDADISNIGIASQRPYDLIEQGTPSRLFYSPTKFKESKNLNSLIQVKSYNAGVTVKPFWGDIDNCVIGINRLDVNLNYNIRPTAIFMGSLFGDSRKNSYNKRCRPRRKLGTVCEQVPREGTIEMLRKTIDGQVERFDVEGGRVIDANGAWAYQIPMNLDYVVTSETGDLIPSDDPNRGIPTRARVRFRVSMDEGGGVGKLRTRGKYIIPHNPSKISDMDFSFGPETKDNDNTFRDMYWNKIYSVKNFISRTERNTISFVKPFKIKAYSGIKDVDGCVGDKSPVPFNRTFVKGNILFTIICFLFSLISLLVYVVNGFLCKLIGIKILWVRPFGWVRKFLIKLKCPNEEESVFTVGCKDSISSYLDCVKAVLADELGLFQMDFYNDWLNGALYYYLLKYKKTRKGKEKFCETNCNDYQGGTGYNSCKNSYLRDTTYDERTDSTYQSFRNGMLVKHEGNLYYPPILLNGKNLKMFPTDLINLGAVLDCDWQGFPKIIQYMTNTTYKIPPLVAESHQEEGIETNIDEQVVVPGMFPSKYGPGLFFDVGCLEGVTYGSLQARNVRRQCELNVDIVESIPPAAPPTYIGVNQIYDTNDPVDVANSINRYVRDAFYLLNTSGSSISVYPPISPLPNLNTQTIGTSFGINNSPYVNGSAYDTFRGWVLPNNGVPDLGFQTNNSFFMYFGIIPGKTALDKLNSKFFTTCDATKNNEFVIDTLTQSPTINGGSDGSITISFIGGVGPFKFQVDGVNVSFTFGPSTVNTTTTTIVTGLVAGQYQITATDSLGTTVIKFVTVDGPPVLACSVFISQQPSTQTSNDGTVDISQIIGGGQPYLLTIKDSNGNIIGTYPNPTINQTISNLGVGLYDFIISDTSGNTCTSEVELIAPTPLVIYDVEIVNECSGCDGVLSFKVSGGTGPYTTTLTGPSGLVSTDTAFGYNDLCNGTYVISAQDSGEPQFQTAQTTVSILGGIVVTRLSSNPIFPGLPQYKVTFRVSGGVPPYNVTIESNSVTANPFFPGQYIYEYTSTIPLNIDIIDNGGCYANKIVPLI